MIVSAAKTEYASEAARRNSTANCEAATVYGCPVLINFNVVAENPFTNVRPPFSRLSRV
jgi:hypothetical protein